MFNFDVSRVVFFFQNMCLFCIKHLDANLAGLQQSAATSQELTMSAGGRRRQEVPVCSEEKLCYFQLYSKPRQEL